MKLALSLEAILQRLVGQGVQTAAETEARSDRITPTSLRLKPETRHFLEAQARVLNTSVQGLIDTILDGVMAATTHDPAAKLRSIRERFFMLVESHHLDLPAAVELMSSHGFTLSALASNDRLLDLMTPKAIDHLATIFHVCEDWLTGKSDTAVHAGADVHWYKSVPSIARRLIEYKQANLRPELMFIRRRGADFQKAFEDDDKGRWQWEPVGIVLRLHRSTPSGKDFTTYQMWEFERWNYGPCRQDLKLLIAFCEQIRLPVVGHQLHEEALDRLLNGSLLPATSLSRLGSISWFPDDYASFAFEVRHEHGEWLRVAARYRQSSLPEMAEESGASPLPDAPWRPAAQAANS